jgi:hypothetical protein
MCDPKTDKIGTHAFMAMVIMSTELCIIFKFGQGEFKTPMPDRVQNGIYVAAAIYALVCLYVVVQIRQRDHKPTQQESQSDETLAILPPITQH